MKQDEALTRIAAARGIDLEDAEYLFNERVGMKTDGDPSPQANKDAKRQAYEELMNVGKGG